MVALAAVSACEHTHGPSEPAVPHGFNFSYLVPDRESMHLVQAFDDGEKTYLQFAATPPAILTIRTSADHEPLRYMAWERGVLIQGTFDHLTVESNTSSIVITNQAAPSRSKASGSRAAALSSPPSSRIPTMNESAVTAQPGRGAVLFPLSAQEPNQLPIAPAVGVPESLQTMNANLRVAETSREVALLEERIEVLSQQLAQLHRQERAATLQVRIVGGSSRVVVMFADGSAQVSIDDTLLNNLGLAARAANRVYVHGHTDAYVASASGTALAIERAVQVRHLLVALKTEPQRIRMFYRGAGDFVANNSTPQGKALNRRVEIELRKW